MTTEQSQISPSPFTHDVYLFVRTGARKGRVFGYWKNGGQFREGDEHFAFIDMLPRGGWDGRIRIVRKGSPPPETEPRRPVRPDLEIEDEVGDDESSSSNQ